MLLNELQQQHQRLAEQQAELQDVRSQLADLRRSHTGESSLTSLLLQPDYRRCCVRFRCISIAAPHSGHLPDSYASIGCALANATSNS